MTATLRRIALTLAALLAVSGAWLTWLAADTVRLRDDPRNVRAQQAPMLPGAGRILTADGLVIAADGPAGRTYPEGVRYAHLVGFIGAAQRRGVEDSRFAALRIRDEDSITEWLLELGGGGGREPNDVVLTVLDPVQRAARSAIEGRTGAVVVLDVATGAVLAYVSSPSYDPNRIVTGTLDPADIPDAVIDRVADRVLPPGSIFKLVVAAAALDAGLDPDTTFPDAAEYLAPGSGAPIGNAGGGTCAGGADLTLERALVVSCNTVFARLAVDLGAPAVVAAAVDAGFGRPISWETGTALTSITPAGVLAADPGALAQTGIGERDVRTTPLHLALLAAAIGNGGVAMQPYVVAAITDPSGDPLRTSLPEPLTRMFSPATARALLAMMEEVVAGGTGTAAAVEGLVVAGKTGTAEGSGGPHAWFVGLAGSERPEVAIAVVVEGGGSGGRVAAPIARAVLAAWRDR